MLRRKSSPLSRGGLYPSDKVLKNQIIHHQGDWDSDPDNIYNGAGFGIVSDCYGDYIAVVSPTIFTNNRRISFNAADYELRLWFYQNENLLFSVPTQEEFVSVFINRIPAVHITNSYVCVGNFDDGNDKIEVYDYSGNYICLLETGLNSSSQSRSIITSYGNYIIASFSKVAVNSLSSAGLVAFWDISGSPSGTLSPDLILSPEIQNDDFGFGLDIDGDVLAIGSADTSDHGKIYIYDLATLSGSPLSIGTPKTLKRTTPGSSQRIGMNGLSVYGDFLYFNERSTAGLVWEVDHTTLSAGANTFPDTSTFLTNRTFTTGSDYYTVINKRTGNFFMSSYSGMITKNTYSFSGGGLDYLRTAGIERSIKSGTWPNSSSFIPVNSGSYDGFGFNLKNVSTNANYMLFNRPGANEVDVYDALTETLSFTLKFSPEAIEPAGDYTKYGTFGFPFKVSDNYFMDSIPTYDRIMATRSAVNFGGDTLFRIYDKNMSLLNTVKVESLDDDLYPYSATPSFSFDMNDTYIVARVWGFKVNVWDTSTGNLLWTINFPSGIYRGPQSVFLSGNKLYVTVSEVVSVDSVDRGYIFIYELDRFTGATDKDSEDWASWRATNTSSTNIRMGLPRTTGWPSSGSISAKYLYVDGDWIASTSTIEDRVYIFDSSTFAAAPATLGSGPTVISSETALTPDEGFDIDNIFIRNDTLYVSAPNANVNRGQIYVYDLTASPLSAFTIEGVSTTDYYGSFLFVDEEDRIYTNQNDTSQNDFIVLDSSGNEISKNSLPSTIGSLNGFNLLEFGHIEVSGDYLYYSNPYNYNDEQGATWKIPLKKVFG